MLQRGVFRRDRLRFSYLERSGGGAAGVLVLLHAHWMGASDFEDIMPALPADWRVAALDQRGHGQTEHGGRHSVDAYIGDLGPFLDHLGVQQPVVLLGNSFGGMVALDQRGHGQTEHGGRHSVDAYIGDLGPFLDHLGVQQPVVLLGNSFGGMVANLYTAARPGRAG